MSNENENNIEKKDEQAPAEQRPEGVPVADTRTEDGVDRAEGRSEGDANDPDNEEADDIAEEAREGAQPQQERPESPDRPATPSNGGIE
jgi:ribonuclease HI